MFSALFPVRGVHVPNSRVRSLNPIVLLLTLLLPAATLQAQQIPRTALTTLDGVHETVPLQNDARPLLLVISFTHAAAADVKAWNQVTQSAYATDPHLCYYELADLEAAPAFLRGMIQHSMRQSIPEPEHAHFAVITAQTAAWKSLVHFSSPDIAYLVLADHSGHVIWQAHGPATAGTAAALRAELARLQAQQP